MFTSTTNYSRSKKVPSTFSAFGFKNIWSALQAYASAFWSTTYSSPNRSISFGDAIALKTYPTFSYSNSIPTDNSIFLDGIWTNLYQPVYTDTITTSVTPTFAYLPGGTGVGPQTAISNQAGNTLYGSNFADTITPTISISFTYR
jgi:hypothetical protein